MAATVWKGYISFGLVLIPVRLFAAARTEHISFHQIHKACGSRIRQQLYCPVDERVVERSELAKGFPIEKDKFVLVTAEELKELEAQSSEAMEIVQFVHLAEVDPLYYETSYYSVAEEPGKKAYALLLQAMAKLNVAAVAKITLNQREQIVLMRSNQGGITLHTLYYPTEVRQAPEYGKEGDVKVQEAEIQLAEQFIRQLTAPWDPERFRDEYQDRVMKLIESKGAGVRVEGIEPPKRQLAPVIDLMSALKKSIEREGGEAATKKQAGRKKPPQRAPAAVRKGKTA